MDNILRHGPDGGDPRVLIVPPLFEEANRLRRTLVLTMRALYSEWGVGSLLPDLPGQNESLVPTVAVDLAQWRTALGSIADAEPGPVLIASIRGGALIDDGASAAWGWWRLSPVPGATLLRTLLRARVASDREAGKNSSIDSLIAEADQKPLLLGGNLLSPEMVKQLQTAEPVETDPLCTVGLGSGLSEVAGTPLWLRAEPGEDALMASAMAESIIGWMSACGMR